MSRPARVAILHYQTFPEIRVAKFAETLIDAGMEVVVVARDVVDGSDARGKHPYGSDAGTSGLDLRSVSGGAGRGWRRALSTPYPVSPLWRAALGQVLREGVDLLIVRDFHLSPLVVFEGHRHGVPVLLDVAENYPALLRLWRSQEGRRRAIVNSVARNVHAAERIERWGVANADAVTVVVPEHEDRMRRLGARQVSTVENTPELGRLLAGFERAGAGDPAAERAAGRQRPIEVSYTGEIHRYRGIDTILAAARQVKSAGMDMCFTLVGTGKLLTEMKDLARRYGVADIVTFEGWQPDLRPYIARADIGLIPPHASAHQEMTMPNKLYDFMAFGKPVVVSDAAPMRRVVETTGAGLVFPAGDADALAQCLIRLGDPADRHRMGDSGAQAVRSRYNWSTDAEALLSVVRTLLSGGPRRAAAPAERSAP